MRILRHLLALIAAIQLAACAHTNLCSSWSAPMQVGGLNTRMLPESSGVAASRAFPDRLYHHNDSGDGPYFYITDRRGAGTRRIEIARVKPRDMEDMALGPCPGRVGKTCLVFGDIGDNRRQRDEIRAVFVEEVENFPDRVDPLMILRLRYPDGPHNAEALVVHPNGDLYIITKEMQGKISVASPARFYRLPSARFATAVLNPETLEPLGTLNVPFLNDALTPYGQIVTGAALSTDGKRLLLLTYENVVELSLDLAAGLPPTDSLHYGTNYDLVSVPGLAQQEGITFLPGDRAFLVTTESTGEETAPMLEFRCQD